MLIKFEVKIELPVVRFFWLFLRQEEVSDAVHSECRLAKDTHYFEYGSSDFEIILNDGNETICNNGNVNLYSDGILRFPPKPFDLKVLLNPFEEQLHLPAIFVKQGNVLCTEEKVVRVVSKGTMQVRSIVDNPSDNTRIFLQVLLLREANTLILEYIICTIKQALAIDNLVCWLAFLPDNEEGSENVNAIESIEVKVASVKYIACKSFVCEPVHGVDIMNFCISDSVKHRYLCGDVNLGMDSDARLRGSELCPSEHGHAEVDCCGVDSIEPAVQLKLLRDTLRLSNCNHMKGKLLEDTMVSEGIGLRQHLPVDGLVTKSEVFRLLSMGDCNICEFSEASATHELTEHKNQQMVPMRHRPTFCSVVVLSDNAIEMPLWEKLCHLRKNELSYMHIYTDLESDAKVGISKPGHGFGRLRCYA